MSGYNYSAGMSNRAVAAYNAGLSPVSRITRGREMSNATELRNKTEWRELGFAPKAGELPVEIKRTRAPWGWCRHHLYRPEQLRPLRHATKTPPHQYEKSNINVALATFIVNRSAKRYRDAASNCYWKGAHSFAGSNKSKKDTLYWLKDKGVKMLVHKGLLKCVAKHDKMYLWQGLGYSFHSHTKPKIEPALISDETIFIEARPPQKSKMRLKDAMALLNAIEEDAR